MTDQRSKFNVSPAWQRTIFGMTGLVLMFVGLGFAAGWPIACIITGSTMFGVTVAGVFKGMST